MITCLGKSYLFGTLCVSFMNVIDFCVSPRKVSILVFADWMLDLIVLIPNLCLSKYFPNSLLTSGIILLMDNKNVLDCDHRKDKNICLSSSSR